MLILNSSRFLSFFSIYKKIRQGLVAVLFLSLIGITQFSCVEQHPAISTFTGDMVYSYLQKDTAYSEFLKLVDKAGLKGMLSAYGQYTCLVPTNSALKKHYNSIHKGYTLDDLTLGQIDTLAYTHIIQNKYETKDFDESGFGNLNMNKRYIQITYIGSDGGLKIMLNDSSQIIKKDLDVYNGVIHVIDKTLKSVNYILPEYIKSNTKLSIFSSALFQTGLSDSLTKVIDTDYHPTKKFMDEYDGFEIINPGERRFAYTAFIESDEVFNANQIYSLEDLIERAKILYPEATDPNFKSPNNSLNKFIAYHLVNKVIYENKFFYRRNTIANFTPDEFIETYYKNRLIMASYVDSKITLNAKSNQPVHIVKGGGSTINGVYHIIDNILAYTQDVEAMFSNTRIRFDFSSLFPEMTNNNIRGSVGAMTINNGSGDRFGFELGYLTGTTYSIGTRLMYLAGKDGQWYSYQSDEVMAVGNYDITIRLLPLPPGTYEFRFGYSAWSGRSIAQIYIDGKPQGIPLDLKVTSDKPSIGYVLDKNTDDNGYENDKMMRNRGYMKGPTTILSSKTTIDRDLADELRKIVGVFSFDTYAPHYIRFRSVETDPSKQCELDYFELVPKAIYAPVGGEPESRD